LPCKGGTLPLVGAEVADKFGPGFSDGFRAGGEAPAPVMETASTASAGYCRSGSLGSADERYLSLSDLFAVVCGRSERSRTRTLESSAIRVEASRDNADRLALMLPGSDAPIAPTHWSFGQLAAWSARRHPICASFRRRSPVSTSNMA